MVDFSLGRFPLRFNCLIIACCLLAACAMTARAADDAPKEQLDRAFAQLQQADEQIPADSYDPVAVVKAAGGRPDELFAWVRDNTRWVPYRGALRGATGTLVDRLGNGLDRSLLLAEFYRHTPVTFRLAHAKLTEDQARSLYQKLRAAPRPATVAFTLRSDQGPAAQKLKQLGDSLGKSAAAGSDALVAAYAPPKTSPVNDADVIDALADHWWLQRNDGAQWVDLDVTIPGAKPGDHLAAPAETFPLANLTPDVWHTLKISVIAERWADGKLTQSPVLTRTVRPGAVVGATIYLIHLALDWAHDPAAGGGPDAARQAREQALAPTEWIPILRLGPETATEAGIRPDGSVDAKPQMDATARAGGGAKGAGQAALDAFGGGPAAPPPAAAAPAGLFTAEWIEYTLHAPGSPDEVIRRDVFDLIGPAARAAGVNAKPAPSDLDRANAALTLRGRIDIVALPCQPSPNYVAHLLLRSLLDSKPAIEKALAAIQSPGGAEAEQGAPILCPAPLYGLSLLRRLNSRSAADWYIARANVFALHNFARLTADDRQTYCEATDLIANDVAVEPGSKADPIRLRLDQGVLDTVAEATFLPHCVEHTSAAQTLAEAASQSLKFAVVRGPADVEALHLPADDTARIRAEVSGGRTVVVPTSAVKAGGREQVAWWSIDPSTGRTVGIADHGWGSSITEDTMLKITQFIMTHKRWVCLGAVVSTVAYTISPLFNLGELTSDALAAIQAALDAACGAGA